MALKSGAESFRLNTDADTLNSISIILLYLSSEHENNIISEITINVSLLPTEKYLLIFLEESY